MRTGASNRRLDAFANCGGNLWLGLRDGDLFLRCNKCHDRLCPSCAAHRRRALVAAVTHHIASRRERVRFITLTLKCQPVPLADQLDRLLASFRRLRQRAFWKNACTGGAFFVEVKLGENSHAWHAHLHILVEGSFIDQYKLGEEWHAVTGDSFIVDVRKVVEDARVASYVAKYATKPIAGNVLRSQPHLDEAVIALKGRRLVQCFGTWKTLALDTVEEAGPCQLLGRVDDLFAAAAAGDAVAIRYRDAALRKWPTLSVFTPHPTNDDTEFFP